jgi:hypothetical protein
MKKNGEPAKKTGPKGGKKTVTQAASRGEGKRAVLELRQKLEVVEFIEEFHWAQDRVADHFTKKFKLNVSQKSVSKWVSQKEELKQKVADTGGHLRRVRMVKHPLLDSSVALWFQAREMRGEPVTGPLIIAKAKRFAARLGLTEGYIEFSTGWLDGFKKRHGIANRQHHGEAGSVNITVAEEERERLQPILADYNPVDIFNVDETAFF